MSGRIRTLKPELLEDEKLSNLDAGARLLFIACILLCDDHGCFRAAPSFLAGQAFWGSRRDARKVPYWFSQLVELRFLKTYIVRGQQFGEVVNWKKHQKIDHVGARRLPCLDEADEVAPEQVPAKKQRSGKSSESLAKNSENLARTSEFLATDLDQDLDLDQDQERERDRPAPPRSALRRSSTRCRRSPTPGRRATVALATSPSWCRNGCEIRFPAGWQWRSRDQPASAVNRSPASACRNSCSAAAPAARGRPVCPSRDEWTVRPAAPRRGLHRVRRARASG